MRERIYKWLPIVFGCHCREDRSFHFRGKKFPICARCTGELVGMIAAIPVFKIWEPQLAICLLLILPLLVDGFTQLLTRYESKNWKRFVTGCLFGIGFVGLIWIYLTFAYSLGEQVGQKICG